MSIATALNLAIALIEERPEVVRGISRTLPLEEMKGLKAAVERLQAAVIRREDQARYDAFLDIEKATMLIEPHPGWPADRVQAWLEGIATVEAYTEVRLNDLRKDFGMDDKEEK